MMPIAYISFFCRIRKRYLTREINRGFKGAVWNSILLLAICVAAAGVVVKILSVLGSC